MIANVNLSDNVYTLKLTGKQWTSSHVKTSAKIALGSNHRSFKKVKFGWTLHITSKSSKSKADNGITCR